MSLDIVVNDAIEVMMMLYYKFIIKFISMVESLGNIISQTVKFCAVVATLENMVMLDQIMIGIYPIQMTSVQLLGHVSFAVVL